MGATEKYRCTQCVRKPVDQLSTGKTIDSRYNIPIQYSEYSVQMHYNSGSRTALSSTRKNKFLFKYTVLILVFVHKL